MCGIKLQDRVPSKGWERETRIRWQNLGTTAKRVAMVWAYAEVEGARPRGKPKKAWREIVEKDGQARKLNSEDAMDGNRWRKQIRDDWRPR